MVPINKVWTVEEIERLMTLADSGATLMRASAALGRSGSSVQKKAREVGKSFAGARQVRANLRASGALEAKQR